LTNTDLGIIVLIFEVKSSWELHNEKGGDSVVSKIKKFAKKAKLIRKNIYADPCLLNLTIS